MFSSPHVGSAIGNPDLVHGVGVRVQCDAKVEGLNVVVLEVHARKESYRVRSCSCSAAYLPPPPSRSGRTSDNRSAGGMNSLIVPLSIHYDLHQLSIRWATSGSDGNERCRRKKAISCATLVNMCKENLTLDSSDQSLPRKC